MDKLTFTTAEKESLTPPVGLPIQLLTNVYRVSYRNPGQLRFSAELVATVRGTNEKPIVVLADGTQMTIGEWEIYRRERYPAPAEAGRNPKNVTLAVKSGTVKPIGGL